MGVVGLSSSLVHQNLPEDLQKLRQIAVQFCCSAPRFGCVLAAYVAQWGGVNSLQIFPSTYHSTTLIFSWPELAVLALKFGGSFGVTVLRQFNTTVVSRYL